MSGLLLTRAMSNYLPSCYIPFDCDYANIWKTNYKDKLINIPETYLNGDIDNIIPFNSTDYSKAVKHNLYFGKFENNTNNTNNVNNITFLNNP
jgi:hypothetical protein